MSSLKKYIGTDFIPKVAFRHLLSCCAFKFHIMQLGVKPSNPLRVSPSPRRRVCLNKQFKSLTAYCA